MKFVKHFFIKSKYRTLESTVIISTPFRRSGWLLFGTIARVAKEGNLGDWGVLPACFCQTSRLQIPVTSARNFGLRIDATFGTVDGISADRVAVNLCFRQKKIPSRLL
jgi:hypothetical protein